MLDYNYISKGFPSLKEDFINELLKALMKTTEKYDINTKQRLAMFLAQVGHESGDFKFLKENLNYSADGLLKVFPKYFNASTAAACARNQEKIANIVYANRMGNGDTASGDGFRFRGRGAIQLTGRNNYQAFADSFEMSIEDATDYLETLEGACMSAGWFWNKNSLNVSADLGDIKTNTKKINGGTIGLDDRIARYNKLMSI
jgi:putative chitinase